MSASTPSAAVTSPPAPPLALRLARIGVTLSFICLLAVIITGSFVAREYTPSGRSSVDALRARGSAANMHGLMGWLLSLSALGAATLAVWAGWTSATLRTRLLLALSSLAALGAIGLAFATRTESRDHLRALAARQGGGESQDQLLMPDPRASAAPTPRHVQLPDPVDPADRPRLAPSAFWAHITTAPLLAAISAIAAHLALRRRFTRRSGATPPTS